MRKLFAPLVLTALMGGLYAVPTAAQQESTHDSVIRICSQVASAEATADDPAESPLRGLCIAETGQYLAVLANLPSGPEYDQAIADLAVELANLLFTPECVVDSEIARAILMTQQSARDAGQQGQILQVYQTVHLCDFIVTAAIRAPGGPVGSESSNSASAN